MEAPFTSLKQEKKMKFKNNKGQIIEVTMVIKDKKLMFNAEISENELNKRKFSSNYSLESIKENNKFFFLCQYITDVFKQIEILSNENNSSFINENNKIILSITTNMPLAPEIKIELNEIEKNIHSKVQDLNDYIIKSEKQNKDNVDLLIKENKELKVLINNKFDMLIKDNKEKFDILIKENKEMKAKINYLENLLNANFGILTDASFEKIKDFIGGDKNKINLSLIYELDEDNDRKIFNRQCNINSAAVLLFVTCKNSIFGAYCPNFNTSENQWINDSNAFVFSLNLNKKYPAKKSDSNYHRGTCGFHFQDITYCYFNNRKGSLGSGYYLDNLELEQELNYFYIRQFLVYKVEKK